MSSISLVSTTEKDHTDCNESNGDDELHNAEDKDKMLRMMDVLTKIMV